MTTTSGHLRKMPVNAQTPAEYQLALDDYRVALNPLIGSTIKLEYSGTIRCVACGKRTAKSYSQGHCFPCMRRLASCDSCIIKPELCHFHEGTCREPEWGKTNCMAPHIVYLANSSSLKVGITRKTQMPTRWLDQGATQAMPIFEVPTRLLAGLVEVQLAKLVADKTNWRMMLKGAAPALDLADAATDLLERAGDILAHLDVPQGQQIERLKPTENDHSFSFPVAEHPQKVTSVTLDKQPKIEGQLMGIKGQYLILDVGVINIRRHAGYEVAFSHDQ